MSIRNVFSLEDEQSSVVGAIKSDGYAIVEDALLPEQLRAIRGDLAPFFDQAHAGHEDFMGRHTKRFGALLAKSKAVQDLLLHPTVLGVADALLLQHSVRYHVHYTGVMQLQPGEKAQMLHRDTSIFPFANPCPPMTIATMWAISDFTEENGGTRFVPGSHRWPDGREPRQEEIVSTEMPAGSVLIYTGNSLHGSGDNSSDRERTGLALHYGMGWLRQEENQYLAVPEDIARGLPDRVLELMGYALGTKNLGFVDHVSPLEYLKGERNAAKCDLSPPALRDKDAALKKLHIDDPQIF